MSKLYSSVLELKTKRWMVGIIEDHQARPLTQEEVDQVCNLLNNGNKERLIAIGDVMIEPNRISATRWDRGSASSPHHDRFYILVDGKEFKFESDAREAERVVKQYTKG